MGDLEPITRNEKLWSGEDLTPVTRREMYIKHLYDETQVIPEYPVTREEMFILKAGEELHNVTIEQLTATENRTYSEEGVAYSPVIVNVPAPSVMSKNITENGDYSASDDNVYGYSSVHVAVPQTTLTTLDVSANGTYTAPSGTAYSEVDVDVPLPENAYLLKEIEDVEIASFNDGSDLPMPKLEVAIEPVQEGSGDPSPENIRPIIGWDEVNVGDCEKNWLNSNNLENGLFSDSDFTIIQSSSAVYRSVKFYLKAGTYVFSSSKELRILRSVIDGEYLSQQYDSPFIITVNKDGYVGLSFRNKDDTDWLSNTTLQVELGSTPTTYEPYNGHTYTLDLDGTRYGGKVDLVSGVMTVDRKYLTIDNFNSFGGSGTSAGGLHWCDVRNELEGKSGNKNICSICGYVQNGWTSTITVMSVGISETIPVRIYDSSESLSDFKDKYPNLQVVYELATPLTIQLSPTVVKSLRGINNVFADTGNILDLSYLAKEE